MFERKDLKREINDLKSDIENLSIKYVSENQLKQEALEKVEKYSNWKRNTIKDIKELIYYLEKHTNKYDEIIINPVIDELNKIIERVIHK